MKVSLTLPSLYPDALDRALVNIENATRNEVEVIVVSPFKPKRTKLRNGTLVWIKETTSTGCNAAHMAAIERATGEYVQAWVDDHFFADGWDVLAIKNFEARAPQFKAPFCLGLRHNWPQHVGTEFGIYYAYFPFMRLEDVKTVGWLTDEYRTGFADSDLSFRIWAAGGRVEWSQYGLISVHPDDGRKLGAIFKPEDMELFITRWGDRYGAGWDTSRLRGFNIDIVPQDHPSVVGDHSVFYNRPDFRPKVVAGGWRE